MHHIETIGATIPRDFIGSETIGKERVVILLVTAVQELFAIFRGIPIAGSICSIMGQILGCVEGLRHSFFQCKRETG
jgi:hypothetical protein